jgi:hypothetical protein
MRALALSVLLFSSCTASQAYVITGESADVLGKQFVAASNAMQAGLAEKKVTPEQFKQWAAFSAKFDGFYGRAVDAWKAAQAIGDSLAVRDIEAAIGRLALELAGFYAELKRLNLLPVGAP